MTCFICEKHQGLVAEPPGGYIYEDQYWMLCHFSAHMAVLGQLVVESRRHFLDFSDMTKKEAESYGALMRRSYSALRETTGAERVYSLVMLEGSDHFHVHLIPRAANSHIKGLEFLAQAGNCDLDEAAEMANTLRSFFDKDQLMSGSKSVTEMTWAGAIEPLINAPTVKFVGSTVLGIYGGNSSAGAHENEDGALIWSDIDADREFAVILDGHNTSESVQLVLDHFALCKSDIIGILNSVAPDVSQQLHEYIRESLSTLDTSSVQGECSCLTFARRGRYLWWFNVGDCALYLLNEDYARLGQYAVSQRSFFEWVGQVNTFHQPVPCYSSGVKSLRQGKNIILALTDGVLEVEDSPFANSKNVYDFMFSSEDIGIQVRKILNAIHSSKGTDSATVIACSRTCNDPCQQPSDI